MVYIISNILCVFIIGFQLQTMNLIYANGNHDHSCKLQNRTIVLKICKNPSSITLPACVGFCSSHSQWDFRLNRFIFRTNACTVTQHRTEEFICPDSTHTAVQLMIPLACSCTKYQCHRHRNHLLHQRYVKTQTIY